MGSQGSFKAAAPSHPSHLAAAAAAMRSTSSTSTPNLSAMAAPFVPTQVQEHHALQSVMLQNPFLHQNPMIYQSPYQMPPGQMDARMFYNTMPHPHPGKHVNASWIKKHNRALSQQKERMYQELMLAQHQRASPPVSVSRRPSIVLPEGDYIGYYFKPKSDYVGYYMKDKLNTTEMDSTPQMSKEVATQEGQAQQMSKGGIATQDGQAQQMSKEGVATHDEPAQQMSREGAATHVGKVQQMSKEELTTHEGPAQQVAVATQEVVISPGGDIDYRVSRQGLTSFLPLLPLDGSILYQTKLEGDYNGPKEPTINISDDHNGGFLRLLAPARKIVSKYAFSDRDGQSTKGEVTSFPAKAGFAVLAEHNDHVGGREYVGYSYATVRGRKM